MAQHELKPWTMLPKIHRYTFFAQYKVKKFKIVKKLTFSHFTDMLQDVNVSKRSNHNCINRLEL